MANRTKSQPDPGKKMNPLRGSNARPPDHNDESIVVRYSTTKLRGPLVVRHTHSLTEVNQVCHQTATPRNEVTFSLSFVSGVASATPRILSLHMPCLDLCGYNLTSNQQRARTVYQRVFASATLILLQDENRTVERLANRSPPARTFAVGETQATRPLLTRTRQESKRRAS